MLNVTCMLEEVLKIKMNERGHASDFFEAVENRKKRKQAIKQAQKYLIQRSENFLELRNEKIIITYSLDLQKLKMYDKSQKNKFCFIDFKTDEKSKIENLKNSLENTFNILCAKMCDNTSYYEVKSYLDSFYSVEEVIPETQEEIKIGSSFIDINKANEKELSKLAGLTLISAKRIIDIREKQNGFLSKQDFYSKTGLKKRFIKQIDEKIALGNYLIGGGEELEKE